MPVIQRNQDGSSIYRCKRCNEMSHIEADQRPRCLSCDKRRAAERRRADPDAARAAVDAVRKQQRLERLVTEGKITIETAIEMGYELPLAPKGF